MFIPNFSVRCHLILSSKITYINKTAIVEEKCNARILARMLNIYFQFNVKNVLLEPLITNIFHTEKPVKYQISKDPLYLE